jgi:hypothetical protein
VMGLADIRDDIPYQVCRPIDEVIGNSRARAYKLVRGSIWVNKSAFIPGPSFSHRLFS